LPAWADPPPVPPPPPVPDVAVSSVGGQTWTDSALRDVGGASDLNFAIGERLRWTISGDRPKPDGAPRPGHWLALAPAQFLLDPGPSGAPVFEWNEVRQLGFEYDSAHWTLDLGRSLVYRGGPRLVDGVQALYQPGTTTKLGVWGGLAPDLFTTDPVV